MSNYDAEYEFGDSELTDEAKLEQIKQELEKIAILNDEYTEEESKEESRTK